MCCGKKSVPGATPAASPSAAPNQARSAAPSRPNGLVLLTYLGSNPLVDLSNVPSRARYAVRDKTVLVYPQDVQALLERKGKDDQALFSDGSVPPPDAKIPEESLSLPNITTMTVAEIKALEGITPDVWKKLIEMEKSTRKRTSALEYMQDQLQ